MSLTKHMTTSAGVAGDRPAGALSCAAFADRAVAGRQLARALDFLRDSGVVVLGLPRGGVPVAYEVARALEALLDVIVVRKLGAPFQPELAMGAVGEDGIRVVNEEVLRRRGISASDLLLTEDRERTEVRCQARAYRAGRPRLDLTDRIVVLVDDGIATGATARAACEVARLQGARRVIFAAPAGATDSVEYLRRWCDAVICLKTSRFFGAVGEWYEDFGPVPEREVAALLDRAAARQADIAHDDA
jgi:putative phosphoribosyl transferase